YLSQTVQDTPLLMDTDHPIVLSEDGRLLKVDEREKFTEILTIHQTRPPWRAGRDQVQHATAPQPMDLYDLSQNQYRLDRNKRVIDKWKFVEKGKPNSPPNSIIKKENLKSPTAFAVDSRGNIYVIDDHHLKRFEASDTPVTRPTTPAPAQKSPDSE